MSIQAFINDSLNKSHKLSRDEEQLLFLQFQQEGDLDARLKIIKSQFILVVTMARKFAKTHRKNDMQDLLQAGFMGLLHASDKFDPNHGIRFENYAKHWVRREIQTVVRNNLRITHIPKTSQRNKIFVLIIKYHKQIADRSQLVEIIKKETGASEDMVKEMVMATLTTDISLNTSISSSKHNIQPEDQNELQDIIPSNDPSPEEDFQQQQLSKILREAIDSLKENERKVMIGKYFEDKSNKVISKEIDRSIVSMLNLELNTRKKLQRKLQHLKQYMQI